MSSAKRLLCAMRAAAPKDDQNSKPFTKQSSMTQAGRPHRMQKLLLRT